MGKEEDLYNNIQRVNEAVAKRQAYAREHLEEAKRELVAIERRSRCFLDEVAQGEGLFLAKRCQAQAQGKVGGIHI